MIEGEVRNHQIVSFRQIAREAGLFASQDIRETFEELEEKGLFNLTVIQKRICRGTVVNTKRFALAREVPDIIKWIQTNRETSLGILTLEFGYAEPPFPTLPQFANELTAATTALRKALKIKSFPSSKTRSVLGFVYGHPSSQDKLSVPVFGYQSSLRIPNERLGEFQTHLAPLRPHAVKFYHSL